MSEAIEVIEPELFEASGAEQNRLFKVSGCNDPDRVADLVFVHGLGGNPGKYWQANQKVRATFWPMWLTGEESLSHLGIWSLGYQAPRSGWEGEAMDLSDRALNVLATLELDLGKKPIVFITHSLGGLIVKKVLQLASGPGTGPKRKAIAEETKGICFIATPHNGSSLANAARILPTLYRPSKATLSLIAHDSSLRDLNDWYRDFATSLAIKTLAFAETSAYWSLIWLKGKVVDQDSANPGLPGERAIPVDGHHLTVHVPTSRQRPLYRQVVAFLEECVANPPSPRLPMRRAAGQSANPTTCPSSASAPSSRAAMAS